MAGDIFLVFCFIITYASIKHMSFIGLHINIKSDVIACPRHCCPVSHLSCPVCLCLFICCQLLSFLFVIFCICVSSTHNSLSSSIPARWHCSELCGFSGLSDLPWKGGGGLVNCFQIASACGASQSHGKNTTIRMLDQKDLVCLREALCICVVSLRSSRRSLNRWTMRPWCFRERPRSTVTPTETCCSALSTMSRWVPLILSRRVITEGALQLTQQPAVSYDSLCRGEFRSWF